MLARFRLCTTSTLHLEKVTFKASLINPIIIANFFILMPLVRAIEPQMTSSRYRLRYVVFEYEKLAISHC